MREEWTVGPVSKQAFQEVPEVDLAEALNTARTFVVELEALYMACMGR